MHAPFARRAAVDLRVVQVLSTGLTLPILSLYSIRLWPPGLVLRLEATVSPGADLGLPILEDVLMPATRQTQGLEVLGGVALALALLMLLIGCATAATLVHRAGIGRREELGIRAAVGATRRQLRVLVVAPLARTLATGALAGGALGLLLLAAARAWAPQALVVPAWPVSDLALLSIIAPAGAAWWGARLDVRVVLRRFASPLTLQSPTRLAPLGLGGAYFGLLVGILATLGTLAGTQSYADVAPQEWAEARDTLLFELDEPGALAAIDALRSADPEGRWHLVSSGALEGLGPAGQELVECNCPIGTIVSPYTRLDAQRHSVTPGAFADLGIPIVRGREFTEGDVPGAEGVVVIDSGHLPRYAGEDPVGKLLHIRGQGIGVGGVWYRIVGVVAVPEPLDLATRERPIPGVYFSALQHPPSHAQVVRRGAGSGDAEFIGALSAAGVEARPLGTLEERLAMWAEPLIWFGWLVGAVSIGAFVVGIYGVSTLTWLNVRSRTTEFGIRRAVGARPGHVRRLVLREVAEIGAVGTAMGAILGVGMTVGLADRFRAVEVLTPSMLLAVVAVLGIAALLSSRPPIRRALGITPVQAIGDVAAD